MVTMATGMTHLFLFIIFQLFHYFNTLLPKFEFFIFINFTIEVRILKKFFSFIVLFYTNSMYHFQFYDKFIPII